VRLAPAASDRPSLGESAQDCARQGCRRSTKVPASPSRASAAGAAGVGGVEFQVLNSLERARVEGERSVTAPRCRPSSPLPVRSAFASCAGCHNVSPPAAGSCISLLAPSPGSRFVSTGIACPARCPPVVTPASLALCIRTVGLRGIHVADWSGVPLPAVGHSPPDQVQHGEPRSMSPVVGCLARRFGRRASGARGSPGRRRSMLRWRLPL
jgi:hypothetical protein